MTSAVFRNATFSGYSTGVLDLVAGGRRILSVPTQLGCKVGCTFCISSRQPLVRNLRADEILAMVDQCLAADGLDDRALEVSFTGEGEPLLNWKQAELVVRHLAASGTAQGARYCLSGLGADKLLPRIDTTILPTRLQVSLHAAQQSVRDRLVPNSIPLLLLSQLLHEQAPRFVSVELNVVLQDGVNDSDADLAALARWGDPAWPILLNPLLTEGTAKVARRAEHFAQELQAAGRDVRAYRHVAQKICEEKIYPQMSARPIQFFRKVSAA